MTPIALLRQGRPSGSATYVLIAIGYALQLAGLGVRGRAVGGCPLGNQFEIYQFTAWSAITLYLVVGVLASEASQVLADYAAQGGFRYNARTPAVT